MSVGCTRLLLATGAPPDHFSSVRGHSPPVIGGRLINMLLPRVTVIFPFARSAMPVLHTLVEGAAACPISVQRATTATRKQFDGLVVPLAVGPVRHTAESPIEPPVRRQGKVAVNAAPSSREGAGSAGGSGLGYDAAAG